MEGYHVMRTHPQLYDIIPRFNYGPDHAGQIKVRDWDSRTMINRSIDYMVSVSNGMAGMVHPTEVPVLESLRDMDLPEDLGEALQLFNDTAREEIVKDGISRGAPMFDARTVYKEHPLQSVEFVFPHFFLLPIYTAMASYRIRPLTPETCYFELWSLALHGEGEEPERPRAPTVLPYDSPDYPEIPRQDYSNVPLQQLGLHAEKFTHLRLSREEEGTISNYHRLIDGYIAGVEPEQLARASGIVNSGHQGPIRDIGF